MGQRVILLAALVLVGCAPKDPEADATPGSAADPVAVAAPAGGPVKAAKGNDIAANPNGNMAMPKPK